MFRSTAEILFQADSEIVQLDIRENVQLLVSTYTRTYIYDLERFNQIRSLNQIIRSNLLINSDHQIKSLNLSDQKSSQSIRSMKSIRSIYSNQIRSIKSSRIIKSLNLSNNPITWLSQSDHQVIKSLTTVTSRKRSGRSHAAVGTVHYSVPNTAIWWSAVDRMADFGSVVGPLHKCSIHINWINN